MNAALVLALVVAGSAAAPAHAQSAAAGMDNWFRGHSAAWQQNAAPCVRYLSQAENVEAEMIELNQRRPRDIAQLNARTAERTRLLVRFRDCANEANRGVGATRPAGNGGANPPLGAAGTPQMDTRGSWADPRAGLYVDPDGRRWQFEPQYREHGVTFRLDASSPPVSAISGASYPVAEYVGPNGTRGRRYGRRI